MRRQVFVRRRKLVSTFEKPMPVTADSKNIYRKILLEKARAFYAAHVDKKKARRVNARGILKVKAKRGFFFSEKRVQTKTGKWTTRASASRKKKKGAKQTITLHLSTKAMLSRKPTGLHRQVEKLLAKLEAILARYESRGTIAEISFEGFSFDAVQSEEKE